MIVAGCVGCLCIPADGQVRARKRGNTRQVIDRCVVDFTPGFGRCFFELGTSFAEGHQQYFSGIFYFLGFLPVENLVIRRFFKQLQKAPAFYIHHFHRIPPLNELIKSIGVSAVKPGLKHHWLSLLIIVIAIPFAEVLVHRLFIGIELINGQQL